MKKKHINIAGFTAFSGIYKLLCYTRYTYARVCWSHVTTHPVLLRRIKTSVMGLGLKISNGPIVHNRKGKGLKTEPRCKILRRLVRKMIVAAI